MEGAGAGFRWDALADRFRVDSEIGRGGMAAVYLAHDLRHDRRVAIKVLLPEVLGGIGAERFLREIRIAAGLDHPNIVPLLDSGSVDGVPYYVMPFVEGETLRARLTREGHLDFEAALHIAGEVADALAFAHERSILHRDVKPENILIHRGHARLADFGVARALEDSAGGALTQVGFTLGTPAYMSPEQALGGSALDGRTDVYSLGVVLFEMLCGVAPFVSTTPQGILAQRLSRPSPPVASHRPGVPPAVEGVVATALAREPEDRYTSAREMLNALASTTRELHRTPARGLERPETLASGGPSLAVLPFANLSAEPDNEYFSDGISEELIHVLGHLPGLRVTGRTSSFAFKGQHADVQTVGRALGVGALLDGSVRRQGSRLRITAQLVSASDGRQLWSHRFDRQLADIFEVQDEIAEAIAVAVSDHFGQAVERQPRASVVQPVDTTAYDLYMRAKYFLSQSNSRAGDAERLLRQALALDDRFGPAYAALAAAVATHIFMGTRSPMETWPEVTTLGRQATLYDSTSGQGEAVLGMVATFFDWDIPRAARHFNRAAALSPNDSFVRTWRAWSMSAEDLDRALIEARHCVTLDPLNMGVHPTVANVGSHSGQLAESMAAADRMIELDNNYFDGHHWKGYLLLIAGNPAAAVPELELALRLSGRWPWAVVKLAAAYAQVGRHEDARALQSEIVGRSRTEAIPRCAVAVPFLHLGDVDGFFHWMDAGIAERGYWMPFTRTEPLFAPARSDPRFPGLLSRIEAGIRGLEVETPATGA
jgi:serine/threonine-protein kinase